MKRTWPKLAAMSAFDPKPTSARSGGTGEELPDATVVRRELAGVPKVEVVGLSKEKVEELFWDTITQVRADLAGVPRK